MSPAPDLLLCQIFNYNYTKNFYVFHAKMRTKKRPDNSSTNLPDRFLAATPAIHRPAHIHLPPADP